MSGCSRRGSTQERRCSALRYATTTTSTFIHRHPMSMTALLKMVDRRYSQVVAALRVAVVADVLLTDMGGVARSVLEITRELARLDPNRIELTVVARNRPPALDGIRFRRSFSPRVPKIPGAIFALQRPLTLRDYDV